MGLLPKEKLTSRVGSVGLCLPAREVGGDFYSGTPGRTGSMPRRRHLGQGDARVFLRGALDGVAQDSVPGERRWRIPSRSSTIFSIMSSKEGFPGMNAVDLAGGSGRIELVNAGQSYPILIRITKPGVLGYWRNGDLPLGAVGEVHYRKDPLQ